MTTPSAPAPAVSLKPDGSLDADKLLTSFLAFWRQHGQPPIAKRTTAEPAATPAGRTITLIRA